ncbi:MAG: YabP/YqfC family sporulation protein [Clostridia bacterium]|nr:YabP/YqfC family sporulation protein [Clostridia bacterium]
MFNFFGEIKEGIKLSKEKLVDNFQMINIAGSLLYVEGQGGLLTLSKEQISFKIKGGVIVVDGENMILNELSNNTIKICGKIKKVEQF